MKKIGTTERTIIVASGDAQVLMEIETAFAQHFNVLITAEVHAITSAIEKQVISAVIICIGERRDDAFNLFDNIYETAKDNRVPILFLAERGNDEDERAAFEAGATDYTVRRPGTLTALAIRIDLRIHAGEYERQVLSAGLFSRLPSAYEPDRRQSAY